MLLIAYPCSSLKYNGPLMNKRNWWNEIVKVNGHIFRSLDFTSTFISMNTFVGPPERRVGLQTQPLRLSPHFHDYTSALDLTHWGRDKMAAISQTTDSHVFSWIKMNEFRLKFHRSLFQGTIDNILALIQIKAGRRIGDKPLSEPMPTRFTDAYMQH